MDLWLHLTLTLRCHRASVANKDTPHATFLGAMVGTLRWPFFFFGGGGGYTEVYKDLKLGADIVREQTFNPRPCKRNPKP